MGIDCFGQSLHQRGYRLSGGISPIKENLASAIIINKLNEKNTILIDPFCGSGTFLTESILFISGLKNLKLKSKFEIIGLGEDRFKSNNNEKIHSFSLTSNYKCRYFLGCDIDEKAVENSVKNIKNMIKYYFNDDYKLKKLDSKTYQFEFTYLK